MTLEMYLEDKFEEGKQIGTKIGENNMAIQTAKKLLAENIPLNIISKCTNLSLQKMEEMAKEKKTK